ncbi:hypothetical protein LJR225_001558 [Phenylobacterium sp. LjRoot225]|uniref:hypothetical protein n=1 Tax=Phenylobacterium sp. LjRoot225 TaxID=3342285 RepID=UPI003ED0C14A
MRRDQFLASLAAFGFSSVGGCARAQPAARGRGGPRVPEEADWSFGTVQGPHPLQPYLGYYPAGRRGNLRGLLQYAPKGGVMWFGSREPLLRWMPQPNGKPYPMAAFADNGRRCVYDLKSQIAAGETLVIAVYGSPPREKGGPAGDVPPFTHAEVAQGYDGPAKPYWDAVRTMVKRIASAGPKATIWRHLIEWDGSWFTDRVEEGRQAVAIERFNLFAALVKSILPDAKIACNFGRQSSQGMASMPSLLKGLKTDMLGVNIYNADWTAALRPTATMGTTETLAMLKLRGMKEYGRRLDEVDALSRQHDLPIAIFECGTGYDNKGIPKDAQGRYLVYGGKAGGDDPLFWPAIHERVSRWVEQKRFVVLFPWETDAPDGHCLLGSSDNVVHRTGRPSPRLGQPGDPYQKPHAARSFVESFGLPMALDAAKPRAS